MNRSLYPNIDPHSTGKLKVSDIHSIYWEQSGNPDGHVSTSLTIFYWYSLLGNPDSLMVLLTELVLMNMAIGSQEIPLIFSGLCCSLSFSFMVVREEALRLAIEDFLILNFTESFCLIRFWTSGLAVALYIRSFSTGHYLLYSCSTSVVQERVPLMLAWKKILLGISLTTLRNWENTLKFLNGRWNSILRNLFIVDINIGTE